MINYIQMLQVPYIIHKVSRYDIRGKRILEYNEKYFFNDIGLRNTIKLNEDLDKGKLLENMVFLHLKTKGYTVYIGNYYGKEIDFIAQRDATIVYIQIAWNIQQEKTQQREFDNLLHIKDNYPKYVITTDTTFGKSYYGIQSMNIIDFLTTFN
ncbi:MAG: DUF4143 domain-containing protein [Candidatus Peribacteria bacterium]|nr:DUF4143 domain-containing protein [Candidatus Peribacteria bacterium]